MVIPDLHDANAAADADAAGADAGATRSASFPFSRLAEAAGNHFGVVACRIMPDCT